MSNEFSSLLAGSYIAQSQTQKEATANAAFDRIVAAMNLALTIVGVPGTTSVSAANFGAYGAFRFTGAIVGSPSQATILVPGTARMFAVINAMTSGEVVVSNGGTGTVALQPGEASIVLGVPTVGVIRISDAQTVGYQPLDPTLTALANLTIAANSLILGTGPDAFNVLSLAANEFAARGSSGSLTNKSISDVALTLLAQTTQALMRTTGLGLGTVATLDSDTDGTLAANSDARVATQKAVKTAIANAVTGLWDPKGATDCSANPNYPAASKGDQYFVSVAGKIGGASGDSVDVGDIFVAIADNAGGTKASVGSSWLIIEHNLIGALVAAQNLADLASAPTALQNLGAFLNSRSDKTGTYTIVAGDKGKLIDCTSGTFQLTMDLANTLGDGFYVTARNSSSGIITLSTAAGSPTEFFRSQIGLRTSITLQPSQTIILFCDGSNFKVLGGNWIQYLTSAEMHAITAAANGGRVHVTDVGANGSDWIFNSTEVRWRPLNGYASMLSTAIPMILPSSGSIGNNGALTLTTALPMTYSGGCFMYFPVNAIVAGSAAGLYYVIMSSTTVGVIYNNTYTSGAPAIPSSPTAFSTTGPGAYTQTTAADLTLLSLTVPGKTPGLHGTLFWVSTWGCSNSANNKAGKVKYGGTTFNNATVTTTNVFKLYNALTNMGSAVLQMLQPSNLPSGGSSVALSTAAIDSSVDQSFTFTANLANAADFMIAAQELVILQTP